MELGTGIFLASLVIGIVFLFHTTKDRWNWKKIMKITGILTLLGVCAVVFLLFKEPVTKWFHSQTATISQPKLTALTEFNGLKLGSRVNDATFLFGKPTTTGKWDNTGQEWWSWKNTPSWGKSMLIAFNNKSSIAVIRFSTDGANDCFHTVCGGDSLKVMQNKLGPFGSYSEGAGGTMRWYKYKKLNTYFIVVRGKVKGFEIGWHTK